MILFLVKNRLTSCISCLLSTKAKCELRSTVRFLEFSNGAYRPTTSSYVRAQHHSLTVFISSGTLTHFWISFRGNWYCIPVIHVLFSLFLSHPAGQKACQKAVKTGPLLIISSPGPLSPIALICTVYTLPYLYDPAFVWLTGYWGRGEAESRETVWPEWH